MSNDYSPVRKLAVTDQVDAFGCDQAALNERIADSAAIVAIIAYNTAQSPEIPIG